LNLSHCLEEFLFIDFELTQNPRKGSVRQLFMIWDDGFYSAGFEFDFYMTSSLREDFHSKNTIKFFDEVFSRNRTVF